MGYVETILEPAERTTHRAYLHWIIYWQAVVLLLIGALLMLFAALEFAAIDHGDLKTALSFAKAPLQGGAVDRLFGFVFIGFVAFLGGAVSFLSAAITRWTTEIAVTNQRVIFKRGLIRRDTIEINMPKVESVDVRQSILGRLLNYGTVLVRGTGGGINPLACVSEPLPLRRAVTLAQKTSSAPS